jgi:hypothetical protein
MGARLLYAGRIHPRMGNRDRKGSSMTSGLHCDLYPECGCEVCAIIDEAPRSRRAALIIIAIAILACIALIAIGVGLWLMFRSATQTSAHNSPDPYSLVADWLAAKHTKFRSIGDAKSDGFLPIVGQGGVSRAFIVNSEQQRAVLVVGRE